MASTDINSDRTRQQNSSNTLVNDIVSGASETRWITDDIPVTIFRLSIGSSGTMQYISNNVEELTGYSKNGFYRPQFILD